MSQLPVVWSRCQCAVDDRRDRPVPRLGVIQDLLGMLRVPPGIEHDQPLGRIEDDGVAVGPAVERHRAGDEMIRLGCATAAAAAAEQPAPRSVNVSALPSTLSPRRLVQPKRLSVSERCDNEIVSCGRSTTTARRTAGLVNPRLGLDVLDVVGERVLVDRAVVDLHARPPLPPQPSNQAMVCFIQFLSSRLG